MFEDDGVCVVEWPEFIEDILPEERLKIRIIKNEDNTRSFDISAVGEKYENILKELMYA